MCPYVRVTNTRGRPVGLAYLPPGHPRNAAYNELQPLAGSFEAGAAVRLSSRPSKQYKRRGITTPPSALFSATSQPHAASPNMGCMVLCGFVYVVYGHFYGWLGVCSFGVIFFSH